MIFIWGKKAVRHSIGYVADFCPVCRDLRRFEVKRIGMASHIYYIPLGEGALLGHVRTCAECGIDLNARPEVYKQVARARDGAAELAAQTRPDWQQVHAERLGLERHIATSADKLPADLRKWLIREPFELLAPLVEQRFGRSQFEWRTAAAVVVLLVLIVIAAELSNAYPTQFEWFYGPAFVIGIGGIVWQLMGVKKRYLESKIYPVIARSLRPIRPTMAELEAAAREIRAGGHKLGKLMDISALAREMKPAAGARSGAMLDDAEMRGSHAA
jgi:hypothetical protein